MKKILVYIFLLSILLTGCIGKKDSESEFKKKDIAPDSLNKVSSGIGTILKNTEKIEKLMDGTYIAKRDKDLAKEDKKEDSAKDEEAKKEKEVAEDANQEQDSSKDSSDKQSQYSSKDNKQDKNSLEEDKDGNKKDEQDEKELEIKKTWEEIEKDIQKVHEEWNSYSFKGMKKGMTSEDLDDFRNSINALTKSIELKNVLDIYDYGSQTLASLAPIFRIYKDEIKGEINQLKYYTYISYIYSLNKDTIKATNALKEAEALLVSMRVNLKEDEEKLDLLEKTNIAFIDIKKALKDKSIKLNRIKRDITIKNLEELEK